jgi:hypothetical protein
VAAFLAVPLWKQITFFISFTLIVVLIASLLSPEARRRLLKMFIRGSLTAWVFYYLIKKNPSLLNGLLNPPLDLSNGKQALNPAENIAPPVFQPPQVSSWLSFFITLGIVLILAALTWVTYLWWKRQNDLLNTPDPFAKIAKVMRASLEELSAPGASPDAIIRCYENMSEAVSKRRGLERNYAMTAEEFAQKLKNAGLPNEPVNRLTRLFESARYSSHTSTQKDIDEAVLCLTTILRYCGEKA